MKEEYAVLRESFLTHYYLLTSVCGDYLSTEAKKRVFAELKKVFCLPDAAEVNCLYEASEAGVYKNIRDRASYEGLCRKMEYAERSGQDMDVTPTDRLILAQLRTALYKKADMLSQDQNATLETILTSLQYSAANGNVDAMLVSAFMEYHGICVSRDRERAIKRMRLCARWNNLCGNLFCLSYDPENRKSCFSILSVTLKGASQKQVYAAVCAAYGQGEENGRCAVAALLEKAFAMGVQKREKYDRAFARVAFSPVIAQEDKEKLLLGRGAGAACMEALPLELRYGEINLSLDPVRSVPLKRAGETEKILQNITVAVQCPGTVYKPLLILGNDEYVADMYATMLKKTLGGAAVAEIDASTLSERDFAKDTDNIFVRTLAATKRADTFFFLRNCEALGEREAEETAKMFDPDYRRHFKLFSPSVSLDLSGVRFVLFAANHPVLSRCIRRMCDTVCPEEVNEKEKETVVRQIFRGFCERFGRPGLTLENNACLSYLSEMDSGRILRTLDGALRRAVYSDSPVLTLAFLQDASAETAGAVKRGFGYTGGNEYA